MQSPLGIALQQILPSHRRVVEPNCLRKGKSLRPPEIGRCPRSRVFRLEQPTENPRVPINPALDPSKRHRCSCPPRRRISSKLATSLIRRVGKPLASREAFLGQQLGSWPGKTDFGFRVGQMLQGRLSAFDRNGAAQRLGTALSEDPEAGPTKVDQRPRGARRAKRADGPPMVTNSEIDLEVGCTPRFQEAKPGGVKAEGAPA